MALEATSRAGKAVARAGYDSIVGWISKLQSDCPELRLLVIGETGAGKSTLINNLLGENVTDESDGTDSATSTVNCHKGMVQSVPVTLYDTPGLEDSRAIDDEKHLGEIRKLIEKETIHLIIYCFKMSETRMRQGVIRTFQQYTEIGVDWRKTVIALTFADALNPSKTVTKREGYSKKAYFEERLESWKKHIRDVLASKTPIEATQIKQIKIIPATSDHEEFLPNGKEWYIPFWLDILEVLPPAALVKFLDIHKANIRYGDEESRQMPKWPENFTLQPPPQPKDSGPPPCTQAMTPTVHVPTPPPQETTQAVAKDPSAINVSVSNQAPVTINQAPVTINQAPVTINQAPITVNPSISVHNKMRSVSDGDSDDGKMKKPIVLLEGERRERFENTAGNAVHTAAGMTAGGVAGAVAAPVVPVVGVGAAVGVVGALAAKVFGWR